ARAQAGLARMAGAALSRARGARDEPAQPDARRQGLRQHLRQAHARRRPLRPAHPHPLRQGPRPPRLRPPPRTRHHQVRRPPQALAPTRAFLTRITRIRADKRGYSHSGFRRTAASRVTPLIFFSICSYRLLSALSVSKLQLPKVGSSGPPRHSQRAIQAQRRATTAVRGRPTRRTSARRYCPGPRISRLPWCPTGVRTATTAPSAVHTTNGVGGRPSEPASEIAIGASSTVVA